VIVRVAYDADPNVQMSKIIGDQVQRGGGAGNGGTGASGTAGCVIITYQSPTQKALGGVVTSYTSGGLTYWVHTFTSSSSITASNDNMPAYAQREIA